VYCPVVIPSLGSGSSSSSTRLEFQTVGSARIWIVSFVALAEYAETPGASQ
jgi:hypothetical protein